MQRCAVASVQSCNSPKSISRQGFVNTPIAPFVSRSNLPRRTPLLPPRAAAAAPPVNPTDVWKATGVPLVDELASFSTIQATSIQAAKLIAIALAGVFVGSLLIKAIASRADSEDQAKKLFSPISSLVGAVSAPAAVLLPWYGYIYSATVVSALVQVAAGKAKTQFNSLCLGNGDQILKVVKQITQLVQDASEIIFIAGVAWTVIGLKDRFLSFLGRTAFKGNDGMARLVGTFSSLLNYLIYAGAFMASLSTCGIDIRPLLASVGASSVVIGLAAQSILKDVASALTLFASPPFAAGDSIKFLSGGAPVMEGTVASIEPLRTVLRTADGSVIYIANSKVTEWEVQNNSRKV